ncbi:MAG: prolipoprotein diacylglyceryl transferase [Alphaproteobacteria bacterium]|nr:prolipoprotein diacylglyceryl transferase [Alphaproteobacteria bacterium]
MTIDPVAFTITLAGFSFAVHWYSLAYIVGILLGWAIMRKQGRWFLSAQQVDDLVFYGTIGIILGGRLGYVLFYNPAYYMENPAEILAVWKGGMSFHGGFIGVMLAMIFFSWRTGASVLRVADLGGAVIPLGLMLGRVANYVNNELGGAPLKHPVEMDFLGMAWTFTHHPSQLYQAALEGLFLLIVMQIIYSLRAPKNPGMVAGAFCVLYAVVRIAVEFVRLPDAHIGYLAWGWLTMGQVLTAPLFVMGVVLIWLSVRERRA